MNTQTITNETPRNLIKFLSFRDIELWDVKRYSSEKITSEYPIVKLGTLIKEESHRVKLNDFPNKEFGFLGVSNKIGIFDAYKEKGSNINQSYKRMESGWIGYNPYRINVGSIGLKSDELQNEYISPVYVIFSCKENLLPDFLYKLFKTERFSKVINDNTTGSVRQNLTFDILKTLDIPIPPVDIQKKLLKTYYIKTEKAIEQDKSAKQKEDEINSYLLDILGVSLKNAEKKKGFVFTKFSLIERWAADYLSNIGSLKGIIDGKFPAQKIRNILLSYQYGLSSKASVEPIGTPMLRMNNINNSELDIEDLKYISVRNEKKVKFLLNKGDLLFNRTNSKELVGKTAVFNLNDEYTFASYIIRLKLDTKKANVEYINYLFNSPIGRIQIDMISRKVLGQANINAQELQDFIFPIPDLNTQNIIVKQISKIKDAANSLRENAESNRKQAIKEFEQEILKIKNMQILSLHIHKYNHLENFTIEFKKSISVIIGANGSGKSSILEILAKIFSAAYLNEKSPLGFELLYSVTHENKEERTSTTSDFITHIVRLSSTGKDEPIKMDTGVLPDGFIISDIKEGKVQLTEQDKTALLQFLPSNIVIYYSGLSDHMEKLCSKHEKKQKKAFLDGNFLATRPLFYYRPENFKMLLLALLSYEFGDTKEFIYDKLRITELSGFSITIKKPEAKWAKGKKAKDVWGAYDIMKNFVAVLGQFAKFTIVADDDNSIEFSFPSMERLYSLKNHFGEEKRFFELLDMALYEEMLDGISITLNKGALQTSSIPQKDEIHLNSDALSEGEQQIIAIKGINEILIQENTLLLFDEPDTYLHPVWQSSFISEIEQYSENAQFIITTHSPQLINNFKEGELHILRKGELIEHSNDFYGRDINSILAGYMGAEIRPEETQTTIDEISNLISEKKYQEAKAKLELLNKNDAEYIRLSTKLNFILS